MPVSRRNGFRADLLPRLAEAAPPLEWTGWYRPRGGQWQPLVNAATEDEAWRALYCAMDNGRSGDWMVLRVGRRP